MKITATAIKTSDGKVWSVPRPGRHDAVLKLIFDTTGKRTVRDEIQGFLDSDGNFLTRAEAEVVARAAGQVTGPVIGGPLTSEDLWDTWRCGYDVETKTHGHGCGHTYEISRRKKRRGERVNPARTTTCPKCEKIDALYKSHR